MRRHIELATGSGARTLADAEIDDICASFQRVVIQTLLDRTFRAAEWFDARAIGIAGGVAANSGLRAAAERARRGGGPAGASSRASRWPPTTPR